MKRGIAILAVAVAAVAAVAYFRQADPVLAPLAAALEEARDNPTGENFRKLEQIWSALPAKQKAATQKNVTWAFCAKLWSKGHTGAVTKRRFSINYQAFLDAVSEPCEVCGGVGQSDRICRTCGGSGIRRVRCGNCTGSGKCPFCHGRGQVGGTLSRLPLSCPQCRGSGRCGECRNGFLERACADCRGVSRQTCRACNGSGRVFSSVKCEWVVKENLDEALRICHGPRYFWTR